VKSDVILLGHGSGGKLSHQLLDELILPVLSGISPAEQNDSALLSAPAGRLAFTTDSYVVDPLFFGGGNIGDLAIHGTVNDLAMAGALPLAISVGLIIEEGFPIASLQIILASMRTASDLAQVKILTGDTKVVQRGKADKLFINTSGIGVLEHDLNIRGCNACPGDKILVNGNLGDHGMAVLASREGLHLQNTIVSDTTPLNSMVFALLQEIGPSLRVLRDPTRGGAATTLKEIALQSEVEITLDESQLPVAADVAGACAILGLDPLYVANEGKLLAFVAADAANRALTVMRRHPAGKNAAIIGEVTGRSTGKVLLKTAIGGMRAIEMLAGEQLPRIC